MRQPITEALRYGTRYWGISQLFLPPMHLSVNHAFAFPAEAGSHLVYEPWRDGRLSWPSWLATYLDKMVEVLANGDVVPDNDPRVGGRR